LFVRLRKNTQPIFTKFDEKVVYGPQKETLDFGGNPDQVTFGLGLGGESTILLDTGFVVGG